MRALLNLIINTQSINYSNQNKTVLHIEKRQYLDQIIDYSSDNGSKGTVVNRALTYLHGGSHEITLAVPLR